MIIPPYSTPDDLERDLRQGRVIRINMPPNHASANIFADVEGDFWFVWEVRYNGDYTQAEELPPERFKTVAEMLLYVFSCLFAVATSRHHALQHYSSEGNSPTAKALLAYGSPIIEEKQM